MTDQEEHIGSARIAFWVAVVALVAAIPPVWPYGFYVLLRLVVTAVSIYAIVVLGTSRPVDTICLAFVGLLFNPLIPVELPKALWSIIDLGVAVFLWNLINRRLVGAATVAE